MNRDIYGIVIQTDSYNPNYADGGDSSNRTGILALVGSRLDQELLVKFHVGNGILVRHPFQAIHDDPKTFTRDQLLPYVAGLWSSNKTDLAREIFYAHVKRFFFCQNTHYHPSLLKKEFPDGPDFLHPGNIWHLILCAKIYWLYWLAPIGYLFQLFDLFWSCFVHPFKEQNQAFSVFTVSGLLPIYKRLHPNLGLAMWQYWSGWRNMREIYRMIAEFLKNN